MTDIIDRDLSRSERRRYIVRGLLRALVMTVAIVALYFLLPLDRVGVLPLWATLLVALVVMLGVTYWQTRAIVRSTQPGLRGIEALAVIAPLYLLLFAASYFVMAQGDPAAFTAEDPTRVDTLYFTVTVFATVGFGDISPASETARLLVMFQMILNLIVLGAGIRLLTAAVNRGRESRADAAAEAPPPDGAEA
ncbi:potassium channel family protein [Agromyces sp. Root81]|uniref:potassium channel family protein n=1 Tax=Agromyces sp. Root81 TaxID=1736601 RepID=UPI000A4C9073|nr:potassium channel family protein [Agromyces sp. Root81]